MLLFAQGTARHDEMLQVIFNWVTKMINKIIEFLNKLWLKLYQAQVQLKLELDFSWIKSRLIKS